MTAKRFTFEIKTQGNKAYTQWYDNEKPINSAETLCGLLNELHEENIQLREHFIYLIATALEDKECRKIYAEGLLEIFDDCSNLDEAKNKIKEYLE